MKKQIIAVSMVLLLSACANSASHEVMLASRSSDNDLTCSEIKMEKRKAERVIEDVQQDKQDMTGADVVDGLLWFPFNVMAKQSNYTSAVKAAEARIDSLRSLAKSKGCK